MGCCCSNVGPSGPLVFSTTHHPEINLSGDRRTVEWKSAADVTGSCFSCRQIQPYEDVIVQFYGTGYVDVGVTDTNPSSKESPIFSYLCGRVLYFDPCVIKFHITNTGTIVLYENNVEKNEKIVLKAREYWLMIKLGCGDIKVTIKDPKKHKDTPK